MDRTSIYYRQVQLLMRVLPYVAEEESFALKGGTAINMFIRDMPRLSVDIDLTYLPIEDRSTSLAHIAEALRRITDLPILALPQAAAMQLNLFENAHFIPIEDAPDGFPYAMALERSELLYWLKKSARLPFEESADLAVTDVEVLVKQRRGQEKLRQLLMDYWDGRCAVTGVKTPELLVASHIKPWSQCESSKEKLDIYNALLLNIAIDRAGPKPISWEFMKE